MLPLTKQELAALSPCSSDSLAPLAAVPLRPDEWPITEACDFLFLNGISRWSAVLSWGAERGESSQILLDLLKLLLSEDLCIKCVEEEYHGILWSTIHLLPHWHLSECSYRQNFHENCTTSSNDIPRSTLPSLPESVICTVRMQHGKLSSINLKSVGLISKAVQIQSATLSFLLGFILKLTIPLKDQMLWYWTMNPKAGYRVCDTHLTCLQKSNVKNTEHTAPFRDLIDDDICSVLD